jgi:nicotinamidase-related amidase
MSKTNTPASALVVVDMQDYFLGNMVHDGGGQGRLDRLLDNVVDEVFKARKNRLPIFMLEYAGLDYEGDGYSAVITNERILDAVSGYSRKYFIPKSDDGGAEELMDVMEGSGSTIRNSSPSRKWYKYGDKMTLRVCGVNLDACLLATVSPLVLYPRMKVEVVADASANVYDMVKCDANWKEENFGNSKKIVVV